MITRELVFINSTGDTFTPTHSGAIATWVWEMCRAAGRFALEPWVISRDSPVQAYPWPRTILLEYPFPPKIRGAGRLAGWLGRMRGWAHICQGEWVQRVLAALRENGLTEGILVFHNDPEMVAALRPALPKAVLVHLFHNCNRSQAPWRDRFSSAVDVALGVSAYCARWNEGYFGSAVHILRNGVDAARFVPLERGSYAPPVLGFVGRTDRQKAPDLLLRAALSLSQKGVPFSVQMLGARFYGNHSTDAYQTGLESLAKRLEANGVRVERPGFVSRLALPRLLARADVHVVPSRWEDPCPLTVLEGMATGQATVGASCGGVPELIGSEGFLFERDDVEGLEVRLRVLLENPELRSSYGARARERALQRPWTKVFGEFAEAVNL
jgi:glycosyltransferase involved in cell wall biosynthesis